MKLLTTIKLVSENVHAITLVSAASIYKIFNESSKFRLMLQAKAVVSAHYQLPFVTYYYYTAKPIPISRAEQ